MAEKKQNIIFSAFENYIIIPFLMLWMLLLRQALLSRVQATNWRKHFGLWHFAKSIGFRNRRHLISH